MTNTDTHLVCLGGTLCDDRLYEPLLTYLGNLHTIWNPTNQTSVEDAARALLETLPDPVVVIGFSLGGFVALEALRQSPERVLGVVLISGNAFPDDEGNSAGRRVDVETGRSSGLAELIQSRAESLVSSSCLNRGLIVQILAAMAAALGDEVHARQAEMNIGRPDLRTTVRETRTPILAIAGTDDRLCPRERYVDLKLSALVELEWIEGSGHFVPLEAPVKCAHLIKSFLERHNL